MRTIRDNYYIITGHTYEEYIKKYRRGIGKGKLLSFTEEETKFLKKHKHYWEVIGPDGKTLYCQVNKLKPKHIIIPAVIAILAGGGTLAGIYLPKLFKKFDGTVTEAEWKSSFEDICNINEQRNLNYTAKGTMDIVDMQAEFKDLNITSKYEKATALVNKKKEEVHTYNFHQVPVKYDSSTDSYTIFYFIRDYFGSFFDGIYDGFNDFVFNKDDKTYTYHSTEANIYNENRITLEYAATIKFSADKKINNLQATSKRDGEIYFTCNYNYEYGDTVIEPWEKSILDELENNRKITFNKKDETAYKSKIFNHTKGQIIFGVLENPTVQNLDCLYLCDDNGIIDTDEIDLFIGTTRIFKNGVELKRKPATDYDFYQILDKTGNKVIGFKLTKPLLSTDKITYTVTLNDACYGKGYHLEVAQSK